MNVQSHCSLTVPHFAKAGAPGRLAIDQALGAIRLNLRGLFSGMEVAGHISGVHPQDPADDRPALATPCSEDHHGLEMMWLQNLFDKVQKALGALTREQLESAQGATRQIIKDNHAEIDKRLRAQRKAESAARKARISGLLQKIAAVVLVVVVAVVAVVAATTTAGLATAAIIGLLSFAGAMINLAGSAKGVHQGNEGFSMTSLMRDAGAGEGADAAAAACSGDVAGLLVEAAVEATKGAGGTSRDAMIVSVVVTVAVLIAFLVIGAKVSKPGDAAAALTKKTLSPQLKAVFEVLKKLAVFLSGVGGVHGGTCKIESAVAQNDAAESRSASARRDAQIQQLEQVAQRLMEILQSMMSDVTRSFNLIKELVDEWATSLTELHNVSGRAGSMA